MGKVANWAAFALTVLTLDGCDAPTTGSGNTTAPAADTAPQAKLTRAGYADVGGARFYYQVFGDLGSGKTPLLILHGSYMSAEAMGPIVQAFARSRPVIAFDARGHGRTGDLPGPITYPQLADDAAGVLDALKVPKADVLGYSLGAITAIALAVRHPARVGKQVIVSGSSERAGWYPQVNDALSKATPAAFAGSPLEAAFKRLSPTPNAFADVVGKLRGLDSSNYDMSDQAVRAIPGKTMIVVGDGDAVQLEHAVKLFRLRGGGDLKTALQGFMSESPRARLAVLPGTAHTGMMVSGPLLAELANPFLDDAKPALAPGFFADPGRK